jgi:hypothetical protein
MTFDGAIFCPLHATANNRFMKKKHHPIEAVPLAGFFVKALPDTTQVTLWAGSVELSIFLNPHQTKTMIDVINSHGNFVAPGSQIRRFDFPLDLLPS